MATNLDIDQTLLVEAQKVGRKKTKKETVNEALLEYIQRRKQREIVSLFDKVAYEESHDYKAERRRR